MKKILVWGLSNNRAGTEAVISAYVRASDPTKYCFDFLCYDEPVNFSDLYGEGTDNRIFKLPVKISHPFQHKRALESFMDEHASEYYAVWFNANDISNIDILLEAEKRDIPHRILHSHNGNIPKRFVTRLFTRFNARDAERVATERWACSQAAGEFMFGGADFKVIPNMVDAHRFAFDADTRRALRDRQGWSDDLVVGTVGRLNEQKNQLFLIELMPDLLKKVANLRIVIIGEGDLKETLEKRADELGVSDRLQILPSQESVADFLSAFDVFAFPSLYEGLSLSALEAQFNGLPCLFSDGVSEETRISTSTQFLSLDDRDAWIDSICGAKRQPDPLIPERANTFDAANINTVAQTMFELD